ncbi:MAG: hypothetical protein V4708_12145 [Bacteroidota bacterium]
MKPFNEHNPQSAKDMKPGEYSLHGDVIIFAEDKQPKGFDKMEKVKDDCVAYGEATGHAHKIFGDEGSFDLRECPTTKIRHLHVVRPVMFKHQEHSPIVVPPGHYRIGIQTEYDPYEKLSRQVID